MAKGKCGTTSSLQNTQERNRQDKIIEMIRLNLTIQYHSGGAAHRNYTSHAAGRSTGPTNENIITYDAQKSLQASILNL